MSAGAVAGRVLLVVLVAVIVGGLALLVSTGQKKEYQATSALLFESFASPELSVLGPGFGVGGPDADRRTATNILLVDSHDVAEAVAKKNPSLGFTADQIDDRVDARALGPTDYIQIAARAGSPQIAKALVLAYRKEFKILRRQREQRRARSAMRALQQSLVELSPRLRNAAEGETIRDQIGRLTVISKIGSGLPLVAEGAVAKTAKVAPTTGKNVLFGLLFGLLLGIGLVALRSSAVRDRLSRSPDDQKRDVRSDWD